MQIRWFYFCFLHYDKEKMYNYLQGALKEAMVC